MRLSAVSYLNTKPFIYGLFRSDMAGMIDLSLDIPSVCAQKLLSGEADLALTPVAIIPELPQAYLVSDFCIGSTGTVQTVCLFSERPVSEIKKVYLDFHSRTSVALTQLLCARYWKIQPEFIPATPGYESKIQGDTAGLIIGDRAIGQHGCFPFVYDLGEAWAAWTGLPFVFAAWVSVKPLHPELLGRFNAALQIGLDHIPELIKILPTMPGFDLEKYFRENISYELDEPKWVALNHFLGMLAGENGYRLHRNTVAAVV
ncbi:MAG: menaquinone biosynthesis protein [Lewinellaceae bacterium]|nr:menaquinone biosynthesis protein [Lewinellaceae bacterium]